MAVTVGEVCAEVHNYHVNGTEDIFSEEFTISDGVITPCEFLSPNQYFRIERSKFNDGVFQFKDGVIGGLTDETFIGYIWAMRVPRDFLDLVKKISDWDDKYGVVGSANMSPYQSESYAGQYSYTKANGTSDVTSAKAMTWQAQFSGALFRWRKACET